VSPQKTQQSALRQILCFVEGGAMSRELARLRAGVEKIASDGERLFVTTNSIQPPDAEGEIRGKEDPEKVGGEQINDATVDLGRTCHEGEHDQPEKK